MPAPFAQGDLDKWHYTIVSCVAHAFLLARQNGCARGVGWVFTVQCMRPVASRVFINGHIHAVIVFIRVAHAPRGTPPRSTALTAPNPSSMGDFSRNKRGCFLMDPCVALEKLSSASLNGAQSGSPLQQTKAPQQTKAGGDDQMNQDEPYPQHLIDERIGSLAAARAAP